MNSLRIALAFCIGFALIVLPGVGNTAPLGDAAAVVANARARTGLAVTLPSATLVQRALGIPRDSTVWAVLEEAGRDGYAVSFSRQRGCWQAAPCVYGSLSVSRTGRDFGYGDGKRIELPCAIAGYYRAPSGMSATDALLTWKRGGLSYLVAIREGRVGALTTIAAGVIAACRSGRPCDPPRAMKKPWPVPLMPPGPSLC